MSEVRLSNYSITKHADITEKSLSIVQNGNIHVYVIIEKITAKQNIWFTANYGLKLIITVISTNGVLRPESHFTMRN